MGQVTYKDKFKEVFGIEPKDDYNYLACPHTLGFVTAKQCRGMDKCDECRSGFWNSEYKPPVKKESNIDNTPTII